MGRSGPASLSRMYKHILVPTDGSALSNRAVREGALLAVSLRADLTIITVTEPPPSPLSDAAIAWAPERSTAAAQPDAILQEAARIARITGVEPVIRQRESDQPWQAVIDAAREAGCDLIAMASHGRSGVASLILGSQTTKVLTHSRIPVIVYR